MTAWTNRRRLLQTGAGVSAAAALPACAGARTIGLNVEKRSLDIANQGEPLSLDPHKASGTWENNIIGNMFIGLTTENEKAEPVPGMATHWETSEDALTWTFHLREATWSDGVPVTAHDFEFAFQRILNPENLAQYAAVLYPILNAQAVNEGSLPPEAVGVRAIDDRTLEIKTEYPALYLPALLKHYTSFPAPRHIVAERGADWIKPQYVAVNGPFKLVRWWSNYIVHLQKNPAFFDAGAVAFEDLYFYPSTDVNASARSVLSGERGWSTAFPNAQYDDLRETIPAYVRVSPYMLVQYFSFNTTKPPFNDMRVRQAMAMSIDREFMATQIYKTGERPAYNVLPPGIANYSGGVKYPWADIPVRQRREEARRLLQAAGYGPNNPLRFEFAHRNTSDNPRVAVVAQADWRSIAPWVEVRLAGVETQIHYDNLRAKNFQAGDGGWVADFNDPKNYLFLFETRTGPQNYSGYSNPDYDRLVALSDAERDPVRRDQLIREAEALMLSEAPICTNVFGTSRNLVDPRIAGWEGNVEDIHRARWFQLGQV
ncbi:MAG: peptide ABC transporter substrate-binding protein [Alphaproteobacteria bacterium]|nr:peptide ABC transporter substrate-binding protein [Alphaproteobacteria bacterium]